MRHAALALALSVSAVAGCRERTPSGAPPPDVRSAASASARPRPPASAARALERAEIPTGAFRAGSEPGDPGRVPELEPRLTEVDLGAFSVDHLVYPNDPDRPPLTGVAREEAERLCTERGARLCTELEWERACKGPASDRYPTGAEWDPACAERPLTCSSGFGVLGMGARFREWTRSTLAVDGKEPLAVVRGGAATDGAEAHRCAARRGVAPDTQDQAIAFRCCAGPPNARKLPVPEPLPAYRKHTLAGARLSELLRADPVTRGLEKHLVFFSEPEAAETVVARGPGDRKGFSFTVAPLLWSPVQGSEFMVLTARSGEKTSFVLAYYVLGEDRYKLASSFVMKDEPGPVALAYTRDIRPRLHFSTCWGCLGETGKILFRRPERAAIVAP